MNWPTVAAICGLIVVWQVVLTLLFRRFMWQMEDRLTHRLDQLGRRLAPTQEVAP